MEVSWVVWIVNPCPVCCKINGQRRALVLATHTESLLVIVVIGCWMCRILENDLSCYTWSPPKKRALPSHFEYGGIGQVRCLNMLRCLACLDLENTGRREFRSGVPRIKDVRMSTFAGYPWW